MEAQWIADRQQLRCLLALQPTWTLRDVAQAVGRSLGWTKKWVARLRAAPPDDLTVLASRSRARHTPPPQLSPIVIDRILAIRDHPPQNLGRIPGPKAILYYLRQEAQTTLAGERLPRSTRTIWQVLRRYQRIVSNPRRRRQPTPRPAPLSVWQLDFKDAATVPPDPDGKQQHVVEVLDVVDAGTSLLLTADVRADCTMATAIATAADTVQQYGLPDVVSVDRDARFVGDTHHADAPSPFLRFWHCLGVQVVVLPPRRPDLNAFVERYHRAFEEECLQTQRPADLDAVVTVTAAFQQHYNDERPHQGVSCGNQPPRTAFPTLPARPLVPAEVDPDRWVAVLHDRRFVRKVQANTLVKLDTHRYYATQEVVGKYVTLRIDARERMVVMEDDGREIKRVPLRGVGHAPMPFATFVAHLCAEARGERGERSGTQRQLKLPL